MQVKASNVEANILFVPIGEEYRASSRLRVWNMVPLIKKHGFDCKIVTHTLNIGSGISGIIRRKLDSKRRAERSIEKLLDWCDIIVLQEVVLSRRLLRKISEKNIKLIFDYSDPIHILHKDEKLSKLAKLFHYYCTYPAFLVTLKNADRVIVENERVAEFSKKFAKTDVLRGPIDCVQFSPKKVLNKVPIIGWTGSPGTFRYIKPLIEQLDQLAASHNFKLILVGCGQIDLATQNLDVEVHDWHKDTEKGLVSSFDIGLFNISSSECDLSRGGGKLFVYMASGVMFIAPNLGIAREVKVESDSGVLFSDEEQFSEVLTGLLKDSESVKVNAIRGRKFALSKYSQEYALKCWLSILDDLIVK
jgi:glycosyltransferase involved in cell wall biosynthesis